MSVSNSTLCHNWAHQLRESQNANSMSFHRNKLYSYSTVIGQRIELEGETVYLLNEGHFSNSTAKHQDYMRSAIPVYAKKFPFKEGEFIYPCSNGLGSWNGTVTKNDMVNFAMTYCRHLYESFLEFQTSNSLNLEGAKKSYRIWRYLLDWCEVTKCTTIKQLLRLTNETWYNKKLWQYHHDKKVVPALKAMLRALLDEKPIPEIVDAACGAGTYQAWVKRTNGTRKAKSTRAVNAMLGFDVNSCRFATYYDSYPHNYKARSSNPSYVRLRGRVKEGKLTSAQIEKMKKNGTYSRELLKIKKANLQINMALEEERRRSLKRYESKKRLEKYIGYDWDGYSGVHEFTHNGVTIQLTYCSRSKMSDNDFKAFCKMSKEEQQAFIKREKAALFQRFTEEIRIHEEWEAQFDARRAEKAKLEALQLEKKQYIDAKKAEGVSGYIQLWHEGLISDSQLYNKGTLRGGNALLRFNKDRNIVQTSKGIEVGIEECKRLWALISRWHANATTFISDKVCSTLSEWTIYRYENDIMIAGCHAISYVEMEDLARDLGLI